MNNNKEYVVITRPAEPSIILDANYIRGKNISQISNDLNLQNEIIFITTPFVRWPLLSQCIATNDYPQIIVKENPGKYTRPLYYLTILPETYSNYLIFYVKVKTQQNFNIPPFEVAIEYHNEYTVNSSFFLQCAIQQFKLEASDYLLSLDDDPVQGEVSFSTLSESNFVLHCTLSEKSQYIIRTRINIIKEIQTTEETYLNGLHHLYDDWRKALLSNKMISEAENVQIFKTFPSIILCHQSFLQSIKERAQGSEYGAIYSDVFLDFASYFKMSLNYITNYHKIISIIKQKSEHKEWTKKLNDLESSLGLLSNYLITPVQRMPRYILFLRELIKFTPPSHPDSELLKRADESMKEIAKQIDDASTTAENENKVFMIHKSLENFNLLEASRVFVAKFHIVFSRSSTYPAILYIFNDLILVSRKEKGYEKEVYNCALDNFQYSSFCFKKIIFYGRTLVMKRPTPIIIEFKNNEEKNAFDKIIEKQKEENIKLKKLSPEVFSFSALPDNSNLYLYDILSGCECVTTEKGIFSFAGSKILWYNIFTNKIEFIPTRMDQRSHYSLNYIEETHTIYLFGGISKNGEVYNELWSFNVQTMKENFIITSNTPEQRYGHTAVIARNINCSGIKENQPVIVVFGGISKKRKYLNDLYFYDLLSHNWICKSSIKNSPPPRAFHSCSVYSKINKNVMYLYGGEQDRENFYSDFYSFDFYTMSWKEISSGKLEKRAFHKMIIIGDDLIVLGGMNSAKMILPPLIIETEQETEVRECMYGVNNPPILKDFGIATANDYIYLFTGELFDGKYTANTIYRVKPPSIIDMSQTNNKISNNKKNNSQVISKSNQINNINDLAMFLS